jgi:hypothetical protein
LDASDDDDDDDDDDDGGGRGVARGTHSSYEVLGTFGTVIVTGGLRFSGIAASVCAGRGRDVDADSLRCVARRVLYV